MSRSVHASGRARLRLSAGTGCCASSPLTPPPCSPLPWNHPSPCSLHHAGWSARSSLSPLRSDSSSVRLLRASHRPAHALTAFRIPTMPLTPGPVTLSRRALQAARQNTVARRRESDEARRAGACLARPPPPPPPPPPPRCAALTPHCAAPRPSLALASPALTSGCAQGRAHLRRPQPQPTRAAAPEAPLLPPQAERSASLLETPLPPLRSCSSPSASPPRAAQIQLLTRTLRDVDGIEAGMMPLELRATVSHKVRLSLCGLRRPSLQPHAAPCSPMQP